MANVLFSQIIASKQYHFGTVLKFLRERKGISSRALANKLGCSSSYVSKLENNNMIPAANIFAKLVAELECSDVEVEFLLMMLEDM